MYNSVSFQAMAPASLIHRKWVSKEKVSHEIVFHHLVTEILKRKRRKISRVLFWCL